MKTHSQFLITLAAVSLTALAPCSAAPGKGSMTNPNLTKGEPIPEGATHDWTLLR